MERKAPIARVAVCDPSEISVVGIAHSLSKQGMDVAGTALEPVAAFSLIGSGLANVVLVRQLDAAVRRGDTKRGAGRPAGDRDRRGGRSRKRLRGPARRCLRVHHQGPAGPVVGGGDQGRASRRGATFTRHDRLPCGGVPVTRAAGGHPRVPAVQPPPHQAGVGGAVVHRRGLHEPARRGAAQHLDGDGANARLEHPCQAGDAEPLRRRRQSTTSCARFSSASAPPCG